MDTLKYIEVNEELFEVDIRMLPSDSMLYLILTENTQVAISKKIVNKDGNKLNVPYLNDEDIKDFDLMLHYLNTGKVKCDIDILIVLLDYFGIITIRVTDYPMEFMVVKLEEEWCRRNRYNPFFEHVFSDPYHGLIKLTDEQTVKIIRDLTFTKNCYLTGERKKLHDSTYLPMRKEAKQLINNMLSNYGKSIITSKKNIVAHMGNNLFLFDFAEKKTKSKKHDSSSDSSNSNESDSSDSSSSNESDSSSDSSSGNESDSDNEKDETNEYHEFIDSCNLSLIQKKIRLALSRLFFADDFKYQNVEFQKLIWNKHLVLAGGSFTYFLNDHKTTYYPYYYFIGLSADDIEKIITSIIKHTLGRACISRSTKSISICNVAFSLKPFKSISELLNSFDIDAYCVAYDGENLYTTPRGKHAFDNLINVIDFDNMSEYYEGKLCQCMENTSFSIYVPLFDFNKIKWRKVARSTQFNWFYTKPEKGINYILANVFNNSRLDFYRTNEPEFYDIDKYKTNQISKDLTIGVIESFHVHRIMHVNNRVYKKGKFDVPQDIALAPEKSKDNRRPMSLFDIKEWYMGKIYNEAISL